VCCTADMVVSSTDKLLHWFGSAATPQSMSPPGFGTRLLAIAPSSSPSCPKTPAPMPVWASRFSARAATMVR